jgi:hypothetical protein
LHGLNYKKRLAYHHQIKFSLRASRNKIFDRSAEA